MKKQTYKMREMVVKYPGMDGWYFVGVNKKVSQEIREKFGNNRKGFGSLPVTVTVGKTSWNTSIFPDKRSGMYVLPLKAAVRKKEGIVDGEKLSYTLEIR